MIDARGLSCPEPVILLRGEMQKHPADHYEISVDNRVSVENISRLAAKEGFTTDVRQDGDVFTLRLQKA